MQKALSSEQVKAFYHDHFVADQTESFLRTVGDSLTADTVVIDVGGGCGYFASALASRTPAKVRVIDMDPVSVATCRNRGLEAEVSDALKPVFRGDESIACFNLILHHLIGTSEGETLEMQSRALKSWHARAKCVFVNEYIYESFLSDDLSGRLIWQITSSKLLSLIGRTVATIVPSLRANTFGVGVRFRSSKQWKTLFESQGYEIAAHLKGTEEEVSLPRRFLFIKGRRRDSFLLRPVAPASVGQGAPHVIALGGLSHP